MERLETVIEMNEEWEYSYKTQKKERMKRRLEAIFKIADGEKPRCSICGCPHAEILQFGHFNGDGSYHRKKINSTIISWILKQPIEVVKMEIQLECPFCNFWHGVYGEYPSSEKKPQWQPAGFYPHKEQIRLDRLEE